jgi:hypothetical protein
VTCDVSSGCVSGLVAFYTDASQFDTEAPQFETEAPLVLPFIEN